MKTKFSILKKIAIVVMIVIVALVWWRLLFPPEDHLVADNIEVVIEYEDTLESGNPYVTPVDAYKDTIVGCDTFTVKLNDIHCYQTVTEVTSMELIKRLTIRMWQYGYDQGCKNIGGSQTMKEYWIKRESDSLKLIIDLNLNNL